jgi:hypothetical protein
MRLSSRLALQASNGAPEGIHYVCIAPLEVRVGEPQAIRIALTMLAREVSTAARETCRPVLQR